MQLVVRGNICLEGFHTSPYRSSAHRWSDITFCCPKQTIYICNGFVSLSLFSGYYYTILPHVLLIRCQHVFRAHALNEKGPATLKGSYNMPIASDPLRKCIIKKVKIFYATWIPLGWSLKCLDREVQVLGSGGASAWIRRCNDTAHSRSYHLTLIIQAVLTIYTNTSSCYMLLVVLICPTSLLALA